MIAAIIALAAVIAYLLTGWRLAVRDIPQAWVRARRDWLEETNQRGSVKIQTAGMFLFWPALTVARMMSDRLGRVVDAGDPKRLAAQIAERDRRIAELESELGIR